MLIERWNIWKSKTKTSTKIKNKCGARCKYNKMTNGQLFYDEFALEHFLFKKKSWMFLYYYVKVDIKIFSKVCCFQILSSLFKSLIII
jgi:hypothetical protein